MSFIIYSSDTTIDLQNKSCVKFSDNKRMSLYILQGKLIIRSDSTLFVSKVYPMTQTHLFWSTLSAPMITANQRTSTSLQSLKIFNASTNDQESSVAAVVKDDPQSARLAPISISRPSLSLF